MALQTTSISAKGSKGNHKFTLNITEDSTSTINNNSSISWSLVLSPVVSGYDWDYSGTVPVTYSVTIDGETYTGNIMKYDGTSTVTVKSGKKNVDHNDDGSKEISFSFSVSSLNVYYLPGSASEDGTLTLTDISREATITNASNFSDGENPTITYSNPAGTAVTELAACISNIAGNIAYAPYRAIPKSGTSYTFVLTDDEKQNLREAAKDSNSIYVRFYVRTKIGDTYYYSRLDRNFTITNANPIITADVVDANEITVALTGDSTKLIKYCSNARARMSAIAQKAARIDESSFIIRNGNNSASTSYIVFENVESNEFTFSATDSRGNVGTASVVSPMVNYIKLTCNIASNKPDALGNMNVVCSGAYFNGNFGATHNELTVQYRYAQTGGSFSGWTNMSVTISGNSYTAYADFDIPDFMQTKSYTFETRAIDLLSEVTSSESNVKSLPLFHWGENDFVFEVPVTFNAGVIGVASAEPILDKGIWTPSLNSSAISSYTTQYGWYSKMGQSVTVGFYIKATCKSGYTSTAISISGLPFTPMYAAAGGGMCSGAYVAANQNFQCFVAETNKTITIRTQASNNTASTNLTTSASGCWYRSGGGEITLSGTISFIANS